MLAANSLQNFLYSRLLSKNVRISVHKTTILTVVLYGCETWCLTLREELSLIEERRSESVQEQGDESYLGLRGVKWKEVTEYSTAWSFIILLIKYD
jgi:hypothetical protein